MPHLQPLWNAGPVIASHAILAIVAFCVGVWQLAARKGGRSHRLRGWTWVAIMVAVALSSLLISEIGTFGYFSWIHLLAPFTFGTLAYALIAVRHGNVVGHGIAMSFLFAGALVIAGAFTLLPYRVMNDVVTGRNLAD